MGDYDWRKRESQRAFHVASHRLILKDERRINLSFRHDKMVA
jgi:hypothetical protein